jgi:hypothetical protein
VATLEMPGGDVMHVPFHTGMGWTEDPTAVDVLECLASDASTVANGETLEEWCGEYCEDPSCCQPRKMYRAVVKQTRKLRAFLGDRFDEYVRAER